MNESMKSKPRGRPFTSENNPKRKKKASKESNLVEIPGSTEIRLEMQEPLNNESETAELIDSVDFKNGPNVLKIVFRKQHNRSFRIQVFLNETTEIRPVTYTGSSTALSFWDLLKKSMTK